MSAAHLPVRSGLPSVLNPRHAYRMKPHALLLQYIAAESHKNPEIAGCKLVLAGLMSVPMCSGFGSFWAFMQIK